MKSVLISIRPEWCEKIISGKKTLEIRKTRPRIETPFKCYIYCTNRKLLYRSGYDKKLHIYCIKEHEYTRNHLINNGHKIYSGKVIGEFVCNKINETGLDSFGIYEIVSEIPNERINIVNESCLSFDEYVKYSNLKPCYAWHISDLVIYDEPKVLAMDCEFITNKSTLTFDDNGEFCYTGLTRPPQSWCYVEKVG